MSSRQNKFEIAKEVKRQTMQRPKDKMTKIQTMVDKILNGKLKI